MSAPWQNLQLINRIQNIYSTQSCWSNTKAVHETVEDFFSLLSIQRHSAAEFIEMDEPNEIAPGRMNYNHEPEPNVRLCDTLFTSRSRIGAI